jgi:uncharacterized protein
MSATTAASPQPISQFVIKVNGRCDLACDHCYVFEHADQSWRVKAMSMAPDTLHRAASRIAEHAAAWRLPVVHVIVHGGEPLLLAPGKLDSLLADLRATVESATRLDLRMQTNGVRLTEQYCDVLAKNGVKVGVSLDGDQIANDRHRRFAHGGSSFDQVLAALELLRRPEYRSAYAGILCTVDVRNDPIQVYEALVAQQPPRIDFLLPHATWDSPPLRPDGDPTPYATWLRTIYLRWLTDGRPMRVRMFEGLLSAANGGPSGTEQFGIDPVDLAVIDTTGEWEQADSLKTAYDGAPATGMTVFDHSADDVSALPEFERRRSGVDALSATCQACPVVRQCGGGLFAHRYRSGSGFDNPSVYCQDLKEFIGTMNAPTTVATGAVEADLPPDLIDQIGSGYGDEAALRHLATTQLTITRSLLSAAADELAPIPAARAAWELLTELDRSHPDVLDDVLAHPYVRAWAVACLRNSGDRADNSGYLTALAAAAAIRAGIPAALPIPDVSERLYLPTVGTATLPSTASGAIDLRDLLIEPVAVIQHGGWTVRLEDADPYRDCHNWTPAARQSPDEVQAWGETLGAAWESVHELAPGYAPGLRFGVRTVVPLEIDPAGTMRASTARNAFGSVAAALADHEALAVMVVHEFQHGKLGAVLDLCDLFEPSARTMRVGWRPDPRPIEGVIQGAYAHVAVADIWRARVRRAGPRDADAAANYRQYRDWTIEAIDGLRGSRALTPAGEQLVERMAKTISEWSE